MTQFKNLIEATQYFSDKQTCIDYLTKMRWNGKITCAHCNHDKVYELKGANKRYKCAKCRKQFSAIKGTIFENSPIPLQKWFVSMYIISAHKKGISSCQLAKNLGVTQKTAWFMGQRIRYAAKMRTICKAEFDTIVECDETYVGGKMKNKHVSVRIKAHEENASHVDNKVCVMGYVERDGYLKLEVAKKTETLKEHVVRNVAPQAVVFTDGFIAYKGLDKVFEAHETVDHKSNEYVRGIVHTNNIECVFSHFKRMVLGTYHQISPKHLERYIDEFEFRYNSRKVKDAERFENLVSLVNTRLTYKSLIA